MRENVDFLLEEILSNPDLPRIHCVVEDDL